MPDYGKGNITVDRRAEIRSKEISNMISEGGLGADEYYIIQKRIEAQQIEDNKKIRK